MAEKAQTEQKLTLEKFEQAYEIVKKVTKPTGLIESEFFSQSCGNKVYLKPENMQVTGAYKIRGAYYKISTLSDADRKKGLITASAGNHAQGVAYAAKAYGVKATIVMPTSTPLIKVNRTKSYGAGLYCRRACRETAVSAIKRVTELMLSITWRRSVVVWCSPETALAATRPISAVAFKT